MNDKSILFDFLNLPEYSSLKGIFQKACAKRVFPNYTLYVLWSLRSRFCKNSIKKYKYIFHGFRYQEIIKSLPINEVCIVGGINCLLFCLKNGYGYISSGRVQRFVYENISNDVSNLELSKFLEIVRRDFASRMQSTGVLIVGNDSLPEERIFAMVIKDSGYKSICIQHGIFQSKSNPNATEGRFVDYFFAFTAQQADIVKSINGVKTETIGFYKQTPKTRKIIRDPANRKVLIVGQPWDLVFNGAKSRNFEEIIVHMMDLFRRNNIEFAYKIHPGEVRTKQKKLFKNVCDISIEAAFEGYDIFISVSSTLLYEAHLAGRIAIQVLDDIFCTDDFALLFGIKSIKYHESNFDEMLLNIIRDDQLSCGSETMVDPTIRFKQLVHKITEESLG
jgi:hypothetical protein